MTFTPTSEQRKFINHLGSVYVKACPGAGKTHTIVNRLKKRLSEMEGRNNGIAILSFTNSAIQELIEKSHKEEIMGKLQYPSFIGTFDSFIWRFIGLFTIPIKSQIKPTLVETWDGIYLNDFGNRCIKGKGISLSNFNPFNKDFNLKGETAETQRIVNRYKNEYIKQAKFKLQELSRDGYYSISDIRKLVDEALLDEQFSSCLGAIMQKRFQEIIVDEAQDCNKIDISILKWLKNSGIPIIVVCDPGQAIYEFRDSTPQELKNFASNFSDQIILDGNFRSSAVICKLSSTLRDDIQTDKALGKLI